MHNKHFDLKLSDILEKGRKAFEDGTLQAVKAQKEPGFRGMCYNTHPWDRSVHCVIGSALPDHLCEGSFDITPIHLFHPRDLTCCPNERERIKDLQRVHDAACNNDVRKKKATKRAFKDLKAMLYGRKPIEYSKKLYWEDDPE